MPGVDGDETPGHGCSGEFWRGTRWQIWNAEDGLPCSGRGKGVQCHYLHFAGIDAILQTCLL